MTVKLWDLIDAHLTKKPALKTERLPTFYPSSASTIDKLTGKPIGACLRAQWYRCMGYEVSNPDTPYSQYIFAAGNIWEKWVTDQFKQMGLYLGNNIKWADSDRYISGEIDLLIKDPEDLDGKPVIWENKTFYSYYAEKELCGNSTQPPKPKDSNLLQAFIYLDQFLGQVNKAILGYLSRENGSRNEFIIEMIKLDDGEHHPKITTFWIKSDQPDKTYSYIDRRISIEGIYSRYELLMQHLQEGKLPMADYRHFYTDKEVEARFESGDIAKTTYAKWQKDKDPYPIRDFQCRYCSYQNMCQAQKEKDGHM